MEPDSEDTRMTLLPLGRSLAVERAWMMNGGAIAEVVYILTCSSHFGPSLKSSVSKYPAVMIYELSVLCCIRLWGSSHAFGRK